MLSRKGKDFKAILDVVHMVNDDQNEGEVSRQALVRLGALVGCESMSYIRVEHATGRMLGNVVETGDSDISHLPGFHAAFRQHPGFAAYHCGRLTPGTSAGLTDLADLPTLRRLTLYTDFQRPYRVHDQLLCVTSGPGCGPPATRSVTQCRGSKVGPSRRSNWPSPTAAVTTDLPRT